MPHGRRSPSWRVGRRWCSPVRVSQIDAEALGAVYVNGDPVAVARRLTLERPRIATDPPTLAGTHGTPRPKLA